MALEPNVPMKTVRDNDFSSKGEMVFRIQSDGKGIMIGNAGTADVAVIKQASSIHFLEMTEAGNLMVLTVYNTWSDKEKGFFFVYQRRAWMWPHIAAGVFSTYWGYAKPWD